MAKRKTAKSVSPTKKTQNAASRAGKAPKVKTSRKASTEPARKGPEKTSAKEPVAKPKAARSKGAVNNSSTKKSSSNKGPFSEKLNTVTPSGYKDQTFFEQVFDVARQIPKGRVTSYGAIAASLGARSSSRLVGWAMNLAGGAKPKVPAHRVVNRIGMLSGKHHFATPTQMQELLEKEGVKVKNDKVVDFNKLFWDPMDLGD
ncbi:MAG: MGMT family protein [Chitinophagaceae bacterium]|nr:MGMT family protein [Chitinophagaceae bacterium]